MVCLTVCLMIILSMGVCEAAEVSGIISFPFSSLCGRPKTVDREGRIWLVAADGFHSFLRGDWESIPIEKPPQYSQPVRVADDGVIWWSQASRRPNPREDAGIWRYVDGTAQRFDDDDGLLLDGCWDLEVDSEGCVWAAGSDDQWPGPYRQYLSWFDGSTWHNRDDLPGMNDWWFYDYNDLAMDLDDSVWCAVAHIEWDVFWDGWTYHWDGENLEYFCKGYRFGAVDIAPDGTKWFFKLPHARAFEWHRALLSYDGTDWVWKWDDELGLDGDISLPLYVDRHGMVWTGFESSAGNGLHRYDPVEDESITFSVEDGLGSESVYGMFMDADNNLWVDGYSAVSILLADGNIELCAKTDEAQYSPGETMTASLSWLFNGPSVPADLYVAIQAPSGQIFYVAGQEAEPPFPIFYAAFDGSTEFLQPGPDYDGPGSIPNTPDMKDLAPPPLPLPDPTGLALFAYPVPYFANVPLPAYSAIDDLVLLNTTLPEAAPSGTYTFHVGITAPSSISNLYRTAQATFEVTAD